ncbi:MAG TPA: PDZ domain-containing protein [Isosphaeraceae bacterium]|nr:PDZ domain-containing protein [Isosphaeraceae bacterium]
MARRVWVGRGRRVTALVLASAMGIFSHSAARAQGDGPTGGGLNGTPLAITGIPWAREGVGAYRPVIWAPYSLTGPAVPAWINEQLVACRPETRGGWGSGTLGYGHGGVVPGFSGFGLSFHLGYGYGGSGLGVGAEGGAPFYGGPGYRCGGQPYDGGPAFSGQPGALIRPDYVPTGGPGLPSQPNAGMGPPDRARAEALVGPGTPYFGYDSGEGGAGLGEDPLRWGYRGGFGPFTGASPYPYTHPSYTAEAAAKGTVYDPFSNAGASEWHPTSGGPAIEPGAVPPGGMGSSAPGTTAPAVESNRSTASASPAPGGPTAVPVPVPSLGIDEEPVVGTGGVRGIKVAKVDPTTAADRAGLQPGDVILSSNGYLTERPGNLAWIIAHAAPARVLRMSVRKLGEGHERPITIQLPSEPVNTARPPYLPPVLPGPPPATR